MHWKNLANYDYLGAYSLEGVNEVTLTIKEIKKERVTANGGASEDCIVAKFVETKVGSVEVKPMVLNKTNCKTIEKLFKTGEIENWVGKRIIIYATTTKFARDIVPCLRVKAELPKDTQPTPEVKEEVPEQKHYCSVCGKEIEKAIYDGSVSKYGVALCSKECKDKYVESQNSEEEGEE